MSSLYDAYFTHQIAQTFQHDLELSGRGKRTQQSYIRGLRKFLQFIQKEPELATEDDLRKYILHVKNNLDWSSSTLNVTYCALKLFFKTTLPRDWKTLHKLKAPSELKLPTVLSVAEMQILLKVIEKQAMKCFFTTVYSMGLRLQEALNLQVSDIDSQRMQVHIHRGKGARDRMVPLPEATLQHLRDYYKTHRNPKWIFPAESRNHQMLSTSDKPMSETCVQGCIKSVMRQLNWENRGISTHTLRHCYATHLLESGVSLKTIQKYLGHRRLTSTMIYLHVTSVGEEIAISRINTLMRKLG